MAENHLRRIVASAAFTRSVDAADPTVEVIEIRRRSITPVGEPGAVYSVVGDAALLEILAYCVDYLEGVGYLPPGASAEAGFAPMPVATPAPVEAAPAEAPVAAPTEDPS